MTVSAVVIMTVIRVVLSTSWAAAGFVGGGGASIAVGGGRDCDHSPADRVKIHKEVLKPSRFNDSDNRLNHCLQSNSATTTAAS
jgi:hypothetical protein